MKNNNQLIKIPKGKEMKSFISPKRESICSIKIDLEKGKSEKIDIYRNSNPDELAYNFCLKHNLDFKSVKDLVSKIKYVKENNDFLEKEKENLNFSFNLINKKESCPKSLNNSLFNIQKNNRKNGMIINTDSDNDVKRKKNEFYTTKNIYINSNTITPINNNSNFSKNNLDCTSDNNLNDFNFFSPKANNKNNDEIINNNNNNTSNINNIINNDYLSIKSDYNKKESNDITINSIWTSNFNDSINDKINNLEKAYANFNPDNKKTKNESINFNNKDNNDNNDNEAVENTKEIISEAIHNCMNIIEKEEPIDNINLTVSESNNSNNEMKEKEIKNKTISKEIYNINNTENIPIPINNSIFSEKNDKDNLMLLTPKKRNDYSNNNSCKKIKIIEDNNSINAHQKSDTKIEIDINKNRSIINNPQKSLNFNASNNKIRNNNNSNDFQSSINELLFENEEKKEDNKMNIKNSILNEIKMPSELNKNISDVNNNKNTKINNNLDLDLYNHKYKNNNNNNNNNIVDINIKDYNNKINNNNINTIDNMKSINDNMNALKSYNTRQNSDNFNRKILNNDYKIQKEIKFSLLSHKNNYTISYTNKDNKRSNKRVLKKYSKYYRSYNGNERKIEFLDNNSIKVVNHSDRNSFFFNVMNKGSISSQKNINIIKRLKNYSSIKTINNNENDKHIYSPLKVNKSLNKYCLLSFTRSEKNMIYKNSKTSKNKDNNRTTITSAGNYTNNNSNFINRGSTSIKIYSSKNLNQTFNFSNAFLFKRQQQKKNNSYYKNDNNTIINNSHNLYYTNLININNNNNKNNTDNSDINYKKNKRLILANIHNIHNSINSFNTNINDNSLDYLKTKINTNRICDENKNASNIKIYMGKLYSHHNHKLKSNNLSRNLQAKNDVMISLKNIFKYITKNNKTLDVFTVVNKKNIPEEIFDIVKTIVRNCDKKKRFIEFNEFVNKGFYLFDQFSKEDKITVLNFNKINL
jgi:hypothetical protein